MGQKSGQFIQSLMSQTQVHGKGPLATGIGIVVLILSATGVFAELQSDLNSMWGVEQKSNVGWSRMIVNRALLFVLLVAIGILLVVSLLASTAIAAMQGSVFDSIPGGKQLAHGVEFLVSCGVITVLFTMIFKFLPDARPHWRDVWVGALVTAFLFTVGKVLLALYLGYGSVASPYGVAGSIVLILVWVYYSAQIFLYGAEFTQVYASEHGRAIKPAKTAQWKSEGEGAKEDREEAQTQGKPKKTEWTSNQPATAGSARTRSSENRGEPKHAPAHAGDTVHDLADRVHGWHSLRPKRT
ncbi:MAG TPA: YihY/virulence factor BrkB family protein, partial [Verrucomicrobiae bacterium]|nr:YihY/virulence factor BrkB family protein [Verrucomicrobiae bacterium]